MPAKESNISKPNASRKRKSEEATQPQPPRTQRRLMPGAPKTATDPDGTIRQVQEYSKWGYDGLTDFTIPIPRPPGYGPDFGCTALPYLKPRHPAAGLNPAVIRQPFGPSPATPLVRDQERRRSAHAARDRVTGLRRKASSQQAAVPSPTKPPLQAGTHNSFAELQPSSNDHADSSLGYRSLSQSTLIPSPQVIRDREQGYIWRGTLKNGRMGYPQPPSDRNYGVPAFKDAETEQGFQSWKQEQKRLQIEPPRIVSDDSDRAINHLHSGWMKMLHPSLWPIPAPLQNGYGSAVQESEPLLSPDILLTDISRELQEPNSAIPAQTFQGFDKAGWHDAELVFENPPLPQELQPQIPSQPQDTYRYLHKGASYSNQAPAYAPWQQPLAYTNGYPQQHPVYTSPYAEYPPQQYQLARQIPPGYPMMYPPPA